MVEPTETDAKSTVLIVEDEDPYVQTLKAACERLGWQVVGVTSNYAEFVEAYNAKRPNIVLLDIYLAPDPDRMDRTSREEGLKVLDRLKKEKENRKFTVVIITRHVDEEQVFRLALSIPISVLTKASSRKPEILDHALWLATHEFVLFDNAVAEYLPSIVGSKPVALLSNDEFMIAKGISEMKEVKEIATEMGIDRNLGYKIRRRVLAKLGLDEEDNDVALVDAFRKRFPK